MATARVGATIRTAQSLGTGCKDKKLQKHPGDVAGQVRAGQGREGPLQAPQSAAMALAATWRPKGRLRSVMARTTLGLDIADTFTSSDT